MPFASVPDLIEATRVGKMVVLVDDDHRENEGDLVIAGEHADAASIAFMATRGCGLICLAMEGSLLDRLGLPLMARDNRSRHGTAFTLSIEAREGVETGISAKDRARTIAVALDPKTTPADLVVPGHVFPLRARDGGVLVRAGHTEAAVDLARLAGCKPAGVICEIMKSDGTMARLDDLEPYCRDHGLLLGTIADLISYRESRETLVEVVGQRQIQTPHGTFQAYAYLDKLSGEHHLALVAGTRLGPGRTLPDPILVRVHKASILTDVFASDDRLTAAEYLPVIAAAHDGILLFLHDTAGRALAAQLSGGSLATMDSRDYGIGAQILRHLGVRRMRLISNNERSLTALSGHGLEVVERVLPPSR